MKTLKIEEIQKIVDHFGIGKVQNIDKLNSIEIRGIHLNLYFITTNNGQFLITEFPNSVLNRSEVQIEVDKKFNIENTIFAYGTDKIQFAHVNNLYYSVKNIKK